LRRRYQHDSIVVSATTSIRQQLDRILAAASVIPTIREDRKFYDERVKIWNAVDLANVAAKSARSEWDKSNIRMTIRHNKAVIRVSAYRERLLQALVNIIKNGIEACLEKTNGESAAISVTVNSNETHAVMTIRDEGVGIPEDVRSQITQPLFSTKNNKPNRGIGLFMAARIIQQHSGELYFDSDGQSFTEVTVSLPLIGASER